MSTGSRVNPEPAAEAVLFPYDRRSAVYFPVTQQQWQVEQSAREVETGPASRSRSAIVDVFHSAISNRSMTGVKEGASRRYCTSRTALARNGASLNSGCAAATNRDAQATYWGKPRNSRFKIFADGVHVATDSIDGSGPIAFVERNLPLPAQVTQGKHQW